MKGEVCYDGTLEGLFALLDRLWREDAADRPRRVRAGPGNPGGVPGPGGREAQGLLLDEGPPGGVKMKTGGESRPIPLLPDPADLKGAAGILFQVSADAYEALVYTWMSGLPLEAPALRYALGVLAAAREAVRAAESSGAGDGPADPGLVPWYTREEARQGAEEAARNRGDGDCGAVLAAAYKVAREIDRLMGFLRFKSDERGRYAARCAPDYFVLPALAPHFARRFGDTPWAVIDERRGLALVREGGAPRLTAAGKGQKLWEGAGPEPGSKFRAGDQDPWEEIWRSYHRVIAIESRKNPRLQGQFIPRRYREYLPEFHPD
jgi:hypothetical protein